MARRKATFRGLSSAHGLSKALTGFVDDDLEIVADGSNPRYDPKANRIYVPALPGQDVAEHTQDHLRAYLVHETWERKDSEEGHDKAWTFDLHAKADALKVNPKVLHRSMNAISDVRLNRDIIESYPGAGMSLNRTLKYHYAAPLAAQEHDQYTIIDRATLAVTAVQYGYIDTERARQIAGPWADAIAPYLTKLPLATKEECWEVAEGIVAALQAERERQEAEAQQQQEEAEAEAGQGESQEGEGESQEGESQEGEGGQGEGEVGGHGAGAPPALDEGEAFDAWQDAMDQLNQDLSGEDSTRYTNGWEEGKFQVGSASVQEQSSDPNGAYEAGKHNAESFMTDEKRDEAWKLVNQPPKVGVMTQRLRDALTTEAPGWARRQDKGRVDTRRVAALATGIDRNVFKRKRVQEETSTAVSIWCDVSGSMGSMDEAREFMAITAEALENLGIPCAIRGWTEPDYQQDAVKIVKIKEWDEAGNADEVKWKIAKTRGSGGTPTAMALTEAYEEMLRRPERRRVVIFITDGRPNTSLGSFDHIVRTLDRMADSGIEVIPVGVKVGYKRMQDVGWIDGRKVIDCSDPEHLKDRVPTALAKTLHSNRRRVESVAGNGYQP